MVDSASKAFQRLQNFAARNFRILLGTLHHARLALRVVRRAKSRLFLSIIHTYIHSGLRASGSSLRPTHHDGRRRGLLQDPGSWFNVILTEVGLRGRSNRRGGPAICQARGQTYSRRKATGGGPSESLRGTNIARCRTAWNQAATAAVCIGASWQGGNHKELFDCFSWFNVILTEVGLRGRNNRRGGPAICLARGQT
jgi:hypothetical protein